MIQIEEEYNFSFSFHPERHYEVLKPDGEVRPLLEKWGLLPDSQFLCFRFDQMYHRGMRDGFLASFFKSDVVREHFLLADGKGGVTVPMPSLPTKTVRIAYEELASTMVSLDVFDRLVDNEVVREPLGGSAEAGEEEDDAADTSGKAAPMERVCQMMDVYLPCGITVSDQLRGVFMLGEESEHHGRFTEEEQREFLYHIMWRLCAGGALCQWEDNFVTYKEAARTLYKDLVCVGRDEETNELRMLSHVLSITSVEGVPLFPRDDQCQPSNGNYCYLVVNPSRKEVVVWYHGFWSTF